MTDLTERLESAPKGSRELDKAIARYLGYRIAASTSGPMVMHQNSDVASWDLRHYTTSLDAALGLIPDTWTQGQLSWPGYDNGVLTGNARMDILHALSSGGDPKVTGFGATPALALCIAALKAREAVG